MFIQEWQSKKIIGTLFHYRLSSLHYVSHISSHRMTLTFLKKVINIHVPICLSACLSVRPSVHPSIRPSIHPSISLSICMSVRPSVRPSIHPSLYLSVCLLPVCL